MLDLFLSGGTILNYVNSSEVLPKGLIDEIRKYITADSLGYLSQQGMLDAVGCNGTDYCRACFSGEYPVEFPILSPEAQLGLFNKE